MAIMKKDKYMKRGDINFQYLHNMVAEKWFDNRRVTTVHNSGMGGVDLLNQKTAVYKLYCNSSSGRYYVRLFFDLIDISVVN